MTEEVVKAEASKELSPELKSLESVIESLLEDLLCGRGDRDGRRQVEEWVKTLADKYPEFGIEAGLRRYYIAEADRLRKEFDETTGLAERLALGRSVESYLERAVEIGRTT